MTFVARLRPELVRIAPSWRTFDETIAGLVALFVAVHLLPEAAERPAVDAVIAREREASTALLDIGVGVPHARLVEVARPIVALAVARDGLYEAVPTVPIQIVALVLSPPGSGAHHLRLLSGIATLLRSSELRARLVVAPDPGDALATLRRYARDVPGRASG